MADSKITNNFGVVFQSERDWPLEVPTKFSRDGEPQDYPGNTLICHIPSHSPLLPGLHLAYSTLASNATLQPHCHLLPPSSWHMTILEGVCETRREPELWPPGKNQQPLEEITSQFAKRLKPVALHLEQQGLGPPYRMRAYEWDGANGIGVGLRVQGATEDEEKRMRRLRDVLADALGFRLSSHESYDFHVSVSYLLRHLNQEEKLELARVLEEVLPAVQVEFELHAVEFCTFENMHFFKRLMYLE